jgi:hypothetical protein
MSFISILSDIGKGLKKVFAVGVDVAKIAEPFVDTIFPGISALYNTTVTAVSNAEANAIAAGAQTGTGAQKLAFVVQSIESDFNAYALANGLPAATPQVIENYVNAVVASLNAIPSSTTPPA